MKIFFRLTVLLLLAASGLRAQVPAEIISIMEKCSATQDNPEGVENVISLSAGVPLIKMKGTMNSYSKGKKEFAEMTMGALGTEIKTETGFDGSQYWMYTQSGRKGVADTLYIAPKRESADDYDFDVDVFKSYNDGSMKLKDGVYEITLKGPKEKDMPTKMVVYVNRTDYRLLQMKMKKGLVSIEMTFDKVKYGVSDSRFVLDPKNYPGAVVVHKEAL